MNKTAETQSHSSNPLTQEVATSSEEAVEAVMVSPTSEPTCEATTSGGRSCRAYPIAGGTFCFHHASAVAEERAAARRLGGQRKAKQAAEQAEAAAPAEELRSAAAVRQLMAEIVRDVRSGKLSARAGQVMVTAARTGLDAILKDQSERITRLEELAEELQATHGRRGR